MVLVSDSGEKLNTGNVNTAVELINERPHENWTIYDATADIIKAIKKRVNATITEK